MAAQTPEQVVASAWSAMREAGAAAAMEHWFADGYRRHAGDDHYTREQYQAVTSALYDAFPDMDTEIEVRVVQDGSVAYSWRSSGTHVEPYYGVPPTGKRITATGITIARVEAGQIAEEWCSWDKLSVLHALGIIPLSIAEG